MSEFAEIKLILAKFLAAIETVERIGDLEVAKANAELRFEKAKQQEADLAAERANLLAEAKAEAQNARAACAFALAEKTRHHEHQLRSIADRARAENDSILAQRDRLHAEIDALGKQAVDLRNLVEGKKQELGAATDAANAARAMHGKLKDQLAEIRESLARAS